MTVVLGMTACAPRVEEVDISGVYEVDEALGSAPCGTDLPVSAPAYVKFERVDDNTFKYTGCSDAGGTSCMSLGRVETFDEAIGGGWRNRDTYLATSEGNCFMGYFEMTATVDNTTLTFERSIYEDKMVAPSDCNHAEAQARNTSMPCVDHVVWTATLQ